VRLSRGLVARLEADAAEEAGPFAGG